MGDHMIESAILAEMQELTHQMRQMLTVMQGNQTGTLLGPMIPLAPATGSEPVQQGALGIPGATRPDVRIGTGQFPLTVWRETGWAITKAHTPVLSPSYDCPANGTIQLGIALQSGSAATYPLVTWDNGLNWVSLNGGTALAVGTWYLFDIPVARGDAWNWSSEDATTLAVARIFYIPG